jgi:hypothetical protein
MEGKNMTGSRVRLGEVVKRLLALRGYSSPLMLAREFLPGAPPVSSRSIYRIIAGDPGENLDGEDGEMKLLRLSQAMLKLPPATLQLVYEGDTDGISRLDFAEADVPVRQYIIDTIQRLDPPKRAGRRRTGS